MNFEYSETSKPPPIGSRSILKEGRLKASASQMLPLIRILPFIIGAVVPVSDPNWKCFTTLAKIVDIIMSPVLSAVLF